MIINVYNILVVYNVGTIFITTKWFPASYTYIFGVQITRTTKLKRERINNEIALKLAKAFKSPHLFQFLYYGR